MGPFRHELFRVLWLTTVASQVATWMQNAAAGWQMTVLVESALPVALLQTATSLPFLLVGIPSGALADRVDRRLVLAGSHVWLAASAALLAVLTASGQAAPWVLLALTFSIGLGTAINNPALMAALSDAVPRSQLAGATTLASAAINAARAGGPPVAGVVIALANPAIAFAMIAAVFLGVAVVTGRLAPTVVVADGGPGGVRPSVRSLLALRRFRDVLVRTALFIGGASAIWALLPVVAVRHLDLGPQGFGLLLGLMGAGAVTAAAVLAPLRARMSTEAVARAGTCLFATASLLLATTTSTTAGALCTLLLGFAWLSTRSTLAVAAQISAPARARGRAFATQMLVWHSGQAGGGIAWALVAQRLGLTSALVGCGLILVAGLAFARGLPLPADDPVPPEIEAQLSRADA